MCHIYVSDILHRGYRGGLSGDFGTVPAGDTGDHQEGKTGCEAFGTDDEADRADGVKIEWIIEAVCALNDI